VFVVLSRPQYPTNIGQVSRAMVNLGFEHLDVVEPPIWTPETFYQARQGAARGQQPLRSRKEYASWEEFYNQKPADSVRIGFSRRGGRTRPSRTWESYLKEEWPLHQHRPHLLIFGPEDAGLSTKDLDLVHHICELPSFTENSSYNLSQAVLLALYMWRENCSVKSASIEPDAPEIPQQQFPEEALREWLETLGFTLEGRGVSALTVLRRLILSKTPTPQELSVLEAVIYQTIRKLKARSTQDDNQHK
jgi:tRNA C32,U32 (ribose-2'-O)-methylase TrmJ